MKGAVESKALLAHILKTLDLATDWSVWLHSGVEASRCKQAG